jgi:poly(3-hydroxybutyrate) depolymerase
VPVRVYYPTGTADARPIMIWSHGGNPSADGRTRSEEWGRAFAAAGYISIHPSRVPITDVTPVQSMCNAEGFPAAPDCALFVGQVVAGPIDAVFVLDSLTAIEAAVPDLAGKLDAAHVAVGGHSAGSMVPLVLAGAARQFAGPVHHDGDARPLAFLATGPQGPDYASFDAGFREDSFHDIDARPVLFISGRGDETGPVGDPAHEPAEGRTAGWLSSTRGNKLLSWDNDDTAVHETMDIHQCNAGVQATHCQAFAMLGVAFLDAFLRQRPEAVTYLASGNYETLNAGVIELHRR